MFASKTLAERNNDSRPWVRGDYRYTNEQRSTFPSQHASYLPRPEFQHGKLEGNEALTIYRGQLAEKLAEGSYTPEQLVRVWLEFWDDAAGAFPPEKDAHSHRVLTLWLATYGGDN